MSTTANAIKGTGTGAAAGSVAGPIGAGVGAAIGAGASIWSGYLQDQAEKKKLEEQQRQFDWQKRRTEQQDAEEQQRALMEMLNQRKYEARNDMAYMAGQRGGYGG